jgi:hypothetical protein
MAEMSKLVSLGVLHVLNVQEGDTVVLLVNESLSTVAFSEVRAALASALPGIPTVVLPAGDQASLNVIRRQAADAQVVDQALRDAGHEPE